jgi:transcriptional regulator with XRE-family HTH domain
MADAINPETLKYYRRKAGFHSQAELAKELKCPVDTVSRWETGRTKKPKSNLMPKLLKALKVNWDDLTGLPPKDSGDSKTPPDGIQLNRRVRPSTRTALEAVSAIYGVRWRDILELAPLLFMISAQQSLKIRKEAMNEAHEQMEEAADMANKTLPYLPGGFCSDHSEYETMAEEEESIKRLDVFQGYYDRDGKVMSPFVNHLQKNFDEVFTLEMEIFPDDKRAPDYEIPIHLLQQLAGLSGDDEKNNAILALIQDGSFDLYEIRSKKKELDSTEYLKWVEKRYDELKAEKDSVEKEFWNNLSIHFNIKTKAKRGEKQSSTEKK